MNEIDGILGIDISKITFDVALLTGEKRRKSKKFSNTLEGFEKLVEWLNRQGVERVHACMEVTNTYGHALAVYLHQKGPAVSIVNPSQIKGYGQSQLRRTKNDRADATLIANFCKSHNPKPWKPPEKEVAELQALTRRLDALDHMITQEKNRLETAPQILHGDIEAHIEFLKGQLKALKKSIQVHLEKHVKFHKQQKLLITIVGIGESTAARILAEIGAIENFNSARQLAAFTGVTPQEEQSGESIQGKARLCKIGNSRLRKALYFPALNAIKRCPQIQIFRERLLAKGKKKMDVVGAVMHKLIRVIYGVLKSGQPFDPEKLIPQTLDDATNDDTSKLALAS